MIHKLIIDDRKVETACGIKVIAFYPRSDEIITMQGITEKVIFDNELVTCDRCNTLSYTALDKALNVIAPIMANSK